MIQVAIKDDQPIWLSVMFIKSVQAYGGNETSRITMGDGETHIVLEGADRLARRISSVMSSRIGGA